MAGVINKPDTLNLSGNLNKFILSATSAVSFILKKGDVVLLEQSYEPGPDGMVRIDVKEVVENQLSYTLNAASQTYLQSELVADFIATVDGADYPFRVIKAGVANLADTATNWLKLHFLTWQPNVKKITYYSPEWLTYYAVEACTVKLKATYPNKSVKTISLQSCIAGTATTFNLQYSVIAGKLGNTYPSYYEVWMEKSGGTKLSESQFYALSDVLSDNEQWYLFENSLGGLDTFRAYGTNNLNAEHEHNIAEFGDVREEYQVDTERKYTKNTGYLDEYSRRWMLDFFPSRAKYVYEATAIRKIVVTESNVTYISSELPSSYTFTWQLAEVSALLNLVKNEMDIPDNLVAPDLTSPDFILPPRLAEFPRITLSEGVLIPAFDPSNPKPTVTTYGAIHNTIKNAVVKELEEELAGISGGGGENPPGPVLEIIESTQLGTILPTDKNVYSAKSTDIRIADELDNFLEDIDERYLRKDIDDTAHGNILFDQKIGSSVYLDGMDGKGWKITQLGAAMLDSAKVRSDIYIGGKFGSISFASGFTGWGVEIDIPEASATLDHLTVRKSMKVYELIYSQIYGLNSSFIVSDQNKILYVETCQGFYRCYLDTVDGTARMNLRKDDIIRMQRSSGINIRYFYGEVLAVTSDYFDLRIIDGKDYPQFGDVVFRFGNKTDKNRQGIIYLTSSDDKAPYIDILDGITDQSMVGKIKVRLGNLRGIRLKDGTQLDKYGLYAQGAVFEDTDIYLKDGSSVAQHFSILNGKFESTIEGIRNDMSLEPGNILRNSSFGSNTNYWKTTSQDISYINLGDAFLWMDGSFYTDKKTTADIYRDGDRNVLRILKSGMYQSNELMGGDKSDGVYSFSFFYKVLRPGIVTVGFGGSELLLQQYLDKSTGYTKISKVGKWNGKGDFYLSFTGEVLIYGVSLFNDALADATIKLQTQILQTEEYIKLLASKEYVDAETGKVYIRYDASLSVMATEIAAKVTQQDMDIATGAIKQEISSQLSIQAGNISAVSTKVDNLKKTVDTAGWITSTQGNTLYAAKTLEDGNRIISYINQSATDTTISSSRINLYGVVTFSMLNSSLQTTLNGKVDATKLGELAYQSVITKGLLSGSLQSEINGAMKESVYIAGGLIKASMIDVDNLYAKKLAATEGTVGAFDIDSTGSLYSFDQHGRNSLHMRGPGKYSANRPLVEMRIDDTNIRLGKSNALINGECSDKYIFRVYSTEPSLIKNLEVSTLKLISPTPVSDSDTWKPLYINMSTYEVKYKN